MAAQLFPLLDRSTEAFNQQQAIRESQLQQQQLARENTFRQHSEMLQHASVQSELALRQQEAAREQQLQPLRAQLLQQEYARGQQASAAALFSLQHARDMAPLEREEIQTNISKGKQETLANIADQLRAEKESELRQKLGQSSLDESSQNLVDHQLANVLTIATQRPSVKAAALQTLTNAKAISPEIAQKLMGVQYQAKDIEDFIQSEADKAGDGALSPNQQAQLQVDKANALIWAKRASAPVTPRDQLEMEYLKKSNPDFQSPNDQALSNFNRIMQSVLGLRKNGSTPTPPPAGGAPNPVVNNSLPNLPIGTDGKPDYTQLTPATTYQTPKGPAVYTGRKDQYQFVPPEHKNLFFSTDPKTGAYVPIDPTQAISGNSPAQAGG